jgi:hypothetical protein
LFVKVILERTYKFLQFEIEILLKILLITLETTHNVSSNAYLSNLKNHIELQCNNEKLLCNCEWEFILFRIQWKSEYFLYEKEFILISLIIIKSNMFFNNIKGIVYNFTIIYFILLKNIFNLIIIKLFKITILHFLFIFILIFLVLILNLFFSFISQ